MTVNITELGNGLRVVTDHIASVESVTVGVWVGTGTRDETADNNGVAHFLEHMAFKGTGKRTALDIAKAIENVGGHVNAYTSREGTVYYAKMLQQDLPLGVDILADILKNSLFDEVDLNRERQVILHEIGLCADTPDDIVFDYFQEKAFPDQAMGRPILGRTRQVHEMSRNALREFMAENYTPSRMILAACGRVDHDAFVKLAREHFRDIKTGSLSERAGAHYGGGVDIHDRKDLEQLHMLLGFRGVSYTDEDYYALILGSSILGGGMSSRLFQEVREKRGLAYGVYAFSHSYMDEGIFGVYAGTGEKTGRELLDVTCNELKKGMDHIEESELTRAKAQLKAGLLMARESTHQRCEQNCQQLFVYGRILSVDDLIERVDCVQQDHVKAALHRVFSTSPTFVALGPAGALTGVEDRLEPLV